MSCCHHVLTEVSACACEWVRAACFYGNIAYKYFVGSLFCSQYEEDLYLYLNYRLLVLYRNLQLWNELNDLLVQKRKKGRISQRLICFILLASALLFLISVCLQRLSVFIRLSSVLWLRPTLPHCLYLCVWVARGSDEKEPLTAGVAVVKKGCCGGGGKG